MTATHILLTDTATGTWHDRFGLRPGDGLRLSGSDAWLVTKETLRGGLSEGVDVVTIDNGALSVSVLPTRGMGIWKAKFRGIDIGWKSPVERPVHPAFVPVDSPNGLGWLRGFNEFVCRCGLTSNGPPGIDPAGSPLENPLPLHGRIANLPAHRVELIIDDEGSGRISVVGVVDEANVFGSNLRLTSTISLTAGSADFAIRDIVTNRASRRAESQLLYHINVGPPFLEAGSKLISPATEIVPRDGRAAEGADFWDTCGAPESGYAEQVYFAKPLSNDRGESFALLRNAGGDKGISIHFKTYRLPCLSLWKNTAAIEDGYVIGLEPATNFPNPRSFERSQERVVSLGPGESYETSVRIAVHSHLENIAAIEAIAGSMTRDTAPTVHRTPQKGWSQE
jgi:galactose mutarotase-like enzyme